MTPAQRAITVPLRPMRVIVAIRGVVIVGLAGLAAALWGAQVVFYFPRTVDDLFISLRYADRLLRGSGLTYNDGYRVEGFSNLLWVLLQAGALGLGLDGVTGTKLLGVLSVVALFGGLGVFARRLLGLSWLATLAVLAVTAANSYVMSWALWGLETPLYLALILWSAVSTHGLATSGRTSWRSAFYALLTSGALMICRPEAPLMVLAVWLGTVFGGPRRTLTRRVRALASGGGILLVYAIALLLARRWYFGLWLPHTYYAKQGEGFTWDNFAPFYEQGTHPSEYLFLAGGLVLAGIVFGLRAHLVAVLGSLACLFFVSMVEVDWMPNHRHWLPMWVFAALSWGWLADVGLRTLDRSGWCGGLKVGILRGVTGAVALGIMGWCGLHQFGIDARFSKNDFLTHGRGKNWIRPKEPQAWADAWLSLRRVPPPHARAMSEHHQGMIQQLYWVLEACDRPERETWYVGRDIGRVGYYSPVQVFDTEGLFTPEVVADPEWRERKRASRTQVEAAFAKQPIASELLGPWLVGAARYPRLWQGAYEVVRGGRSVPAVLRRRDCSPPPPVEILERYRRVERAFPSWFYMATLYGESVGAAFDKRMAWVKGELEGQQSFVVSKLPDQELIGGEVVLDGAIRLHGCFVSSTEVVAGNGTRLTCYFEAVRRTEKGFQVFVHLLNDAGRHVFSADHPPTSGWYPMGLWKPGDLIRDATMIHVPEGLAGSRLTAHLGLFHENRRARVVPADRADAQNRIVGPTFEVK